MPLTIPIAHDYNCGWCWIALSQIKRLQAEFDVKFEWRGYELYPEDYEWPESEPQAVSDSKPPTPTRFQLALAAEGLDPLTSTRPRRMKTFRAHQAAEFARDQGCFEAFNERLYVAYWKHGLNINEPETLRLMAAGLISDVDAMLEAVEEKRYVHHVVPFDSEAYETGVYNVPTFWIGDQLYAEQPYRVLRAAIAAQVEGKISPVYGTLDFPAAPEERPTTFINMVSTLDGKIITGNRDEAVMDLGSKTDHATMRHIESVADAVIIGAGALRATPGLWYEPRLLRIVVTESGRLDYNSRFFTDAPSRAIVLSPQKPTGLPNGVQWLELQNWAASLGALKCDFGVQRLLCEGGSELNASLLREDLIDEIFLTLAPKIKLGREVPTIAGGEPLTREQVQNWDLLSQFQRGDELFLRYRRPRA